MHRILLAWLCLFFRLSGIDAVENNAYIYFEKVNGRDLQPCIIWNNHCWTSDFFYHHEKCRCNPVNSKDGPQGLPIFEIPKGVNGPKGPM